MKSITLGELAARLGGVLRGDPDICVTGFAPLSTAKAGDLTVMTQARLVSQLESSTATAVIVPEDLPPQVLPTIGVSQPMAAFAEVAQQFSTRHYQRLQGISPTAVISPSARVAPGVAIGPHVVIGEQVEIAAGTRIHAGAVLMDGCRVGRDCTIYPRVVMYEDTRLGDRVILHGGVVLGANGFGYDSSEGRHKLGHQLGWVEVHNDVEIGANSTIDRGAFGATVIGEGTKLDDLVMVGHNCRIGRHNLLCSQVGIAGSCTTGDYVVMAGQVGIRDHVTIGDQVQIGAKSGVANDLPAGQRFFGIPAGPERKQMQVYGILSRLPEMRRQLKELRRQCEAIQQELDARSEHEPQSPGDAFTDRDTSIERDAA